MKKYLVTGSSGFIGSYLVKELLRKGNVVITYDIKNKKSEDILNLKNLIRMSRGCDGIFHLAAIPSVQYSLENPEETFDVNLKGTINVLEAVRINKISRVVYSSSSAVYGDQEDFPINENAKCCPKSPYALQKYMGEAVCQMYSTLYNIKTVSLRYFNVYGDGQSSTGAYASVIAKFIKLKKEGKDLTITGDGKQTRDFIHVSDVVNANIKAMNLPFQISSDAFNIGSGIEISVNDIANIIGGKKIYIPSRQEPRKSQANIKKAKKHLDWGPKVIFEKGLLKIIKSI